MLQRETELDLLRIISLFYVVCIHINARLVGQFQIFDCGWLGTKLWYMTWCVPAFIMISGRFFLDPDRNITIPKLYLKYIKRIVIAFLFWTIIFEIFDAIIGRVNLNILGHIANALSGDSSSHFWFIFTIIGLYIITPFFRAIAASKELCEYYFVLYFLVQIICYFLLPLPTLGALISTGFEKVHLYFVFGYSTYFLYGYYAKRYLISEKAEGLIYFLGIISFAVSFIGNTFIELTAGGDSEFFTRYLTPTAAIYSIAIYTFFLKRVSKHTYGEKMLKIIEFFAKYGLGMYLVHYMIVWLLPIQLLRFAPVISVPVAAVVTLLVSIVVSKGISYVPVIGKYVV